MPGASRDLAPSGDAPRGAGIGERYSPARTDDLDAGGVPVMPFEHTTAQMFANSKGRGPFTPRLKAGAHRPFLGRGEPNHDKLVASLRRRERYGTPRPPDQRDRAPGIDVAG